MTEEMAKEAAVAGLRALYLFLPLLAASVLSGVVLRFDLFPWLSRPIDGGRMFLGHRVFGDGKTWRGVVVAIVGSALMATLQRAWAEAVPEWLPMLDYARLNPVTFGTALGAGAMLGELPNSLVKRRLGIERGATAKGAAAPVFYVWDQVDLLTTAWPAVSPWVRPAPFVMIASFALALGLHPLVSLIGYLVGARTGAR